MTVDIIPIHASDFGEVIKNVVISLLFAAVLFGLMWALNPNSLKQQWPKPQDPPRRKRGK